MIIFLVSVFMSSLYLTNCVGWTFPPRQHQGTQGG
jgi:hypothetical protein